MGFTSLYSNSQVSIFRPAEFISSSRTWVCPESGIYRICAVGGGGSGGAYYGPCACSGGGGGGYTQKEMYLISDLQLIIVIGEGGIGITHTSAGGIAGGNTTVSGIGINLIANGGLGGFRTTVIDQIITGGSGGTAIGGDINYSGGSGGSTYFMSTGVCSASGGGASGSPYGNGGNGGNVTNGISPSGGGAVGVNAKEVGGGDNSAIGAGTGGPDGRNRLGLLSAAGVDGVIRSGFGPSYSYNVIGPSFDTLYNPFMGLSGGSFNACSGSGAGSSGVLSNSSVKPGVCGGSGGTVNYTSGGGAIIGGGSGGCSLMGSPPTSGDGGRGLVTIERIG